MCCKAFGGMMDSDADMDQWYHELENPEEFYSAAAKYWEVRSKWWSGCKCNWLCYYLLRVCLALWTECLEDLETSLQ